MKQKEANWIKLSEKKASVVVLLPSTAPPPLQPSSFVLREKSRKRAGGRERIKLHHKICYGEGFFLRVLPVIIIGAAVKMWMMKEGESKIFPGT